MSESSPDVAKPDVFTNLRALQAVQQCGPAGVSVLCLQYDDTGHSVSVC